MNEERVFVSIQTDDATWSLVTSSSQVNEFIGAWKSIDGDKVVSIAGVLDHRDANEIVYHLLKEAVSGVHIQKIKF